MPADELLVIWPEIVIKNHPVNEQMSENSKKLGSMFGWMSWYAHYFISTHFCSALLDQYRRTNFKEQVIYLIFIYLFLGMTVK